MTSYKLLPWDSDFFGFGVASLGDTPLRRAALRSVLDSLRARGVRLAYWGPSVAEQAAKQAGLAEHGRLVDTKTTYAIDLAALDLQTPPGAAISAYEDRVPNDDLERLAIRSGRLSRFAVDPEIPRERFEALYRLWIRNSLTGELAREVLVARQGEAIVGMVTLAEAGGCGSIGLVAVDESAQGMGLGSALVQAALRWCRDQGIEEMRVVTQGSNHSACRLYEKHGFRRARLQSFFHFWL